MTQESVGELVKVPPWVAGRGSRFLPKSQWAFSFKPSCQKGRMEPEKVPGYCKGTLGKMSQQAKINNRIGNSLERKQNSKETPD